MNNAESTYNKTVDNIPAYLYSSRGCSFTVIHGRVRIIKYAGLYKTKLFASFVEDGGEKSYGCSVNPGEVHNSSVWFADENREEAFKILVEHDEMRANALNERAESLRRKIDKLKEEYWEWCM